MAFTPEELRQRIPTWSLESDGHLLQYMISIAKNLEEKCTNTRDNLNRLMLQVNQTELKLSTATNEFSAVEQVKFVENRVEEDDESFYGLRRRRQQQQQQQVEEVKEGAKQEPADAGRSFDDLIQLAVERSIEGMYHSYEKVTLQLTDSDTSDGEDGSDGTRMADAARGGTKASVMRAVPRHPFIDRPLPHVIGSKEWQNKWHVGLIDSDDESSSDRKEEYSESSSTDTDDGGMFPSQPNSKNHTPSESESSIWGTEVGRKRAPSMDPSITGDDGSSVYSYASSSKPRTFPATLPVRGMAAPIGASLKPPGLFPEEPPEVVDNGKRSSDKGLFDESPEEEEDAKEPVPMPTPRQTVPTASATAPFFKGIVHQPTRKMVNLFDDEPPPPQEPHVRAGSEPKKAINLFIESDDEEDTKENVRNNNVQTDRAERTVAKSANVRHSGLPAANPRTMTRLVDELNNNFRKQQPDPQPGTVVGTRNPERSLVPNIFDSEPPVDDFDQLFSAANATVAPTSRNALPQPAFRTVEKKTVNLFADDDDDGIVVGSIEKDPEPVRSPFISPNHQIALPKQPERPRGPTIKKKSIFDESDSSDAEKDEGGSGLFAGLKRKQPGSAEPPPIASGDHRPPPKTIKSIFSDSSEEEEDDDDALFGHSSNVVKNKLDALKKNGPSSAPAAAPVTLPSRPSASQPTSSAKTDRMEAKKSLFDDDSDDDAADPLFNVGLPKQEPAKVTLSTTDDAQQGNRNSTASRQMALGEGTEHATKQIESSVVIATSLMKSNRSVDRDPLEVISEPTDTNVPVGVPEAPAESIRSMIMKKSIFNSDSESEEDDAIFGPSTRSVPAEAAAGIFPNGQMEKNEDPPMDNESELISKSVKNESILQRPINSGVTRSVEEVRNEMLQESSNDDKMLDINSRVPDTNFSYDGAHPTAHNSYKDHASSASGATGEEIVHKQTKKAPPAIAQKSIFADSSSESEADADLSMSVNEVKNSGIGSVDRETENRSSGTVSVDVDQTVEREMSFKGDAASMVALGSSQLAPNGLSDKEASNAPNEPFCGPIIDDIAKPVDREPSRTIAPAEEKEASPEPPALGMIANDIDYFLRTNESVRPEASRPVTPPPAVKSEPKSALNFSPIGLFDDVPPPDDEDDVYVHETQKHFQPVEAGSSLPPVDDTPAFPTESQSLNFIPNGAGNGRTRYLFDDEPPPDEADNSGLGFGEPYPFRGPSSKVSLFEDHRQRTVDAPVSLPPMAQDTQAKAQPRPKINKLNAKISINVAALLPGARRPPASSVGPVKTNADVASVEPVEKTSDSSTQPPAAATERTNGDKLTSLNKGRARIPTKRKPPSRQTLRAAAVPSDGASLETDHRVVVGSEQKILHIEGEPTKPAAPTILPSAEEEDEKEKMDGKRHASAKLEPLVDRLSASVRNPSARIAIRPDGNEERTANAEKQTTRQSAQTKSTSIFGDSGDSNDEGDDTHILFGGKAAGSAAPAKAVLRSQPGSKSNSAPRSIFGSDDDDDDDDDTEDIFGGKRRTLASVVATKVSVKPPPPTKGPTSLFGDDGSGSDDSDDLFGGKTKTVSKQPGTQPPIRPIATKVAGSTRTVNDPLADLLDS